MRRIRAAVVPMAFFLGAALCAASLAQLFALPRLERGFELSDVAWDQQLYFSVQRTADGPAPGDPLAWLRVLAPALGVLAAGSWLALHRLGRVRIRASTLLAAALPVAMLVAGSLEVLWPIAAALVVGLALSLRRSLYCSRLISTAVFGSGLIAAVPATAIAHDLALPLHESQAFHDLGAVTIQTATCQPTEPGFLLTAVDGRFIWGMRDVGLDELPERTQWERLKLDTFCRRLEPPQECELTVNLVAPSSLSRAEMIAIFSAVHRAGGTRIDLVSLRPEGLELWTHRGRHEHECAVSIELTDDGVPVTDFTGWTSLLRAADHDGAPLKVRANE